MSSIKSTTISVPGTSANLGPGFDILGMAWKLYNHFHFSLNIEELNQFESTYKNGEPLPFREDDDLVLYSYKKYFELFVPDEIPPYYRCKMELSLPMKGGLGSSASAVVAGFVYAREIHKSKYNKIPLPSEPNFLFELANIEGHPDNTSPAYLGGFVLSYFDTEKHLQYFKKKFPGSVGVFILSPKTEISTSESRKSLPTHYKMEDMIFNMTRIATWIQFFQTRKFSDLCLAVEDRLHTPYRLGSLPYMNELIALIEKKQMTYCLSGSGPTILIFIERKKISQLMNQFQMEMDSIMKSHSVDYDFRRVQPDNLGVRIKRW